MSLSNMQIERWLRALDTRAFGVWDLNPVAESVHYCPAWKQHLGFPRPHDADSTSFWRSRVHPEDVGVMLNALRMHLEGFTATYECRFRLRSMGGGLRVMLSRGRVVRRDLQGNATRMVGTMVDLDGTRSVQAAGPAAQAMPVAGPDAAAAFPFHRLLGLPPGSPAPSAEELRLPGQVEDLLDVALRQSAGARS